MTVRRLLIANRGEIAVRIQRTAHDRGCTTVAVYGEDDAGSLHVRRADAAVALAGRGPRAYLDPAALVAAARASGCDAVHPGYGFLAEQAAFGAACEAAGLVFVGPTPAQLALFGDKIAARDLARRCGVPVLPASPALDGPDALRAFRAAQGDAVPVVLKAAAGGGGRGMRVVAPGADAAALWQAARAEAQAAFGDGTVYAERYLERARHLEVQIVGDAHGGVTHLWERDCSLQRRHQKLIEIAPAPALDGALREALLAAAVRMATDVRYRGLGTFEFLVDLASGTYFFIEANARLQVEHTVTEEVLGRDLVALQLAIADGATLASLGLAAPPPPPAGFSVQLRINAERMDATGATRPAAGRLARYEPASGPGVRVDSAAGVGESPNPAFDSLLAKLVVTSPQADFATALRRVARAAREFVIEGLPTNLPLLIALVEHARQAQAPLDTTLVEREAATLLAAAARLASDATPDAVPATGPASLPTASRPSLPTAAGPSLPTAAAAAAPQAPPGTVAIAAPMRGSVVAIAAAAGSAVRRGQTLVVLEAMKMHHHVEAPAGGTLIAVPVAVQDVVDEGQPLAFVRPDADRANDVAETTDIDPDAARADLDEVRARHAIGLDAARPQAVEKRRRIGGRTARENIADLCDPGSFLEYGALAIAAQRRRRTEEDLMAATPADGMVAGFGTVNAAEFGEAAARCAVFAYDYTVLAGTQGHHNHKKKDRLFALAAEWRTPVVFYTEGGGGRPGDVDTDDLIRAWLDLKTFTAWARLSGLAPRLAIASGRCYAGNAVLFGCADITIATANANIGLAGPAMIEGGGLGRYAPEDIGPIDVQTANGVVDIACADEAEATAHARRTLGYFQGRTKDWTTGDLRRLRHLVPEDRLRVYDMRAVIDALADTGSVTELRRGYGVGLITALVRIEGRPFGLIANDPRHLGGAIDSAGGEKGARFLQLCDAYGLPVVSLCDTPGFMVGPDSEKTAAVRRGSRLIVAGANLRVPLFTIVVRKGYGLGAQAMAGGSFHQPCFTIAWPTAEMGPMGLEGAVVLGYRKELEALADPAEQRALFERLVAGLYAKGKAVSVAQSFEIDAVIDPADTRAWLVRGLLAAGDRRGEPRRFVDVW